MSNIDEKFTELIDTAIAFVERLEKDPEFTLYNNGKDNYPVCQNVDNLRREIFAFKTLYLKAKKINNYRSVVKLLPIVNCIALMEEMGRAKEGGYDTLFNMYEDELSEISKRIT